MLHRRTVLSSFGAAWALGPNAATAGERSGAIADLTVPDGFSGSVLVAQGAHTRLFDGFGMRQDGSAPTGRNDRFWISSTGKQFAAAGVMILVEAGVVTLDDTLSRFFPAAPIDKAAITLRQLLSHTSGLGQSYASEGKMTGESAAEAMLAEPVEAPPGAGFIYSNSNIQLAAAAIETVAGTDYQSFLETRLWSPAGLVDTGFAGRRGAGQVSPIQGELPPRLREPYWGGQGIFSTAGDLFRWVRALRTGTVLSPASVQLLFAPIARTQEAHATLGWFSGTSPGGESTVFARGNDDFGANSLIYIYPDKDVTIVVLTHAGDSGEQSWSRRVHAHLESALGL